MHGGEPDRRARMTRARAVRALLALACGALRGAGGAAAVPTSRHPKERPAAAVLNRQGGNVLLEVLVGTDGVPREVKVSSASAPGVFDDTAIASVKTWRFNPATKHGQPVESWVLVPICYAMDPTGDANDPASGECAGPDAAEALEAIHTRVPEGAGGTG